MSIKREEAMFTDEIGPSESIIHQYLSDDVIEYDGLSCEFKRDIDKYVTNLFKDRDLKPVYYSKIITKLVCTIVDNNELTLGSYLRKRLFLAACIHLVLEKYNTSVDLYDVMTLLNVNKNLMGMIKSVKDTFTYQTMIFPSNDTQNESTIRFLSRLMNVTNEHTIVNMEQIRQKLPLIAKPRTLNAVSLYRGLGDTYLLRIAYVTNVSRQTILQTSERI
jgi:hypothetical protein